MDGTRRYRRALVPVAAIALALVAPAGASASGGGGCGGPVTDRSGTTVEIESFCFTPTILRVEPGQQVTFVNRDRTPHTVLGANGIWGSYDPLRRGHDATYGFPEAGVYPFVCTWHPGMIGTVVVGDGVGGAIDATTAEGPVTQGAALEAAPVASSRAAPAGAGAWPVVAAAAGALFLATAAALVLERSRRRS